MKQVKKYSLLIFIIAGFACMDKLHASPEYQTPKQPNILWISVEDMSPRLGCYGDSTISTPNIDRLAREGVKYSRAFTTAGVCAPSRNAIITGMYQTSTGGHNMRTLYDTYPQQTGLPKSYSVVPPPGVKAFPEYLRAKGYYCTNNEKTDYQFEAPPTVWDESGRNAHWRKRGKDQPFFAVFNSTVTHESQVWMRKDRPLLADPEKIKVPPYYPDTKTVRQDMARFYSNIKEMDNWVGDILKQLEEDGLLENTIIFFWSDHGDGLPFVKREVYNRGIHVPLIVRFPGKKQAGEVTSQMISLIDLAPTVLSLAGIKTPSHMQGRAFLGSYKAAERTYVFAARDRMDSEYDRVRSVRDGRYQYVRNFKPELPLYQNIQYRLQQNMMKEMLELRDAGKLSAEQMKWFVPNKPKEELYDLEKDPYQLNNLAEDPSYATILKRMRNELDRWVVGTKDLGGIPEKELLKQMWKGDNKPPVTADPVISVKNNLVTLSCATESASIGYKIIIPGQPEPLSWQVYTKPLTIPSGATIRCIAQRIGYEKSREVED